MKVIKRILCRKKPAPDATEQARKEQERNERVWKDKLKYREEYDLTEVAVEAIEDYIAHSTHNNIITKTMHIYTYSIFALWLLTLRLGYN